MTEDSILNIINDSNTNYISSDMAFFNPLFPFNNKVFDFSFRCYNINIYKTLSTLRSFTREMKISFNIHFMIIQQYN